MSAAARQPPSGAPLRWRRGIGAVAPLRRKVPWSRFRPRVAVANAEESGMKSVVCLNGNMPVHDTFAPLAKELNGEVALVLKDREAYAREPGAELTLADEV